MTPSTAPIFATAIALRFGLIIDALARLAASRALFAMTVAFAASLIWIAPRPPMIDLPQHVAQIALWRDLILGQSLWAELFRINLLTPYLLGYSLALPLAFVMPPLLAVKIVLTLAFLAFVGSCVQLGRDVGSDRRLDWLFIPGYFGFAYDWGFYTFLVAAPLAIQFVRFAWRHAETGERKAAVWVAGLGTALLFSHGLMFLFAFSIGGLLLATRTRSWRAFAIGLTPYVGLGLLCGTLFLIVANHNDIVRAAPTFWNLSPVQRSISYLIAIQAGAGFNLVPLTIALLVLPWIMGLRLRRLTAVPFAAQTLVVLFVPSTAIATAFVSIRFALFTLPFYAIAFSGSKRTDETASHKLGFLALVAVCWMCLATQWNHTRAFAIESMHFENVLAAAEPGRRAARLVAENDDASPNALARYAGYQPSWYQVEKRGLVEFNFAYFPPQIVRYRPGVVPTEGFAFQPTDAPFDWRLPQASLFDYYFVHSHRAKPPSEFIDAPRCDLKLVQTSGPWSLYERGACKPLVVR